jgi:RNA polymerase sigma-70 factor (ECF subfamily)
MGAVSRPGRRSDEGWGDADLVRRIGAGDRHALGDLYERFRRPAFALARRILADDALAEAVLQDVFVAAWREPGGFDRSRGSVASWLLEMVHREAVELVRREEPHRRRQVHADEGRARGVPAAGRDAEDAVVPGGVPARVRVALAGLPTLQREALTLAYYGGYTQREVAALTGAPLGTVKTRMLAGMRRLREELGEPAGDRPAGGTVGGVAPVDGPGR